MELFRRSAGSKRGGINAPSFDPYNRFRNTGSGIFGMRQGNNVIIPGVTSYEQMRLQNVKSYVENKTGKPCTLSQELINDVYSIYVNGDVKRRPTTKKNTVRHKVLDKVYDSLTKVVTVDSPLYTQMLTRELAVVLQHVDDEVKEQQENQPGKGDNGQQDGLESSMGDEDQDGDGDSQGESQGKGKEDSEQDSSDQGQDNAGKGGSSSKRSNFEDMVDKALENASDKIEEAKDNADQKMKDLKKQIGNEAIKDLSEKAPDFLDQMEKLKNQLSKLKLNKDSIRKVMDKMLNESMNYFSTKYKRVEESLFECDSCEELFGLEFLHPVFKNAELFNVGNEERIYKGKIDLYIDCSGSMDSFRDFEENNMRMIDLVKGIAMILYRMNMIENLYFFDTSLYKIDDVNEISILTFDNSGGTDFEKVISEIKFNGNNSVIITDGYDSCSSYTDKAFWMGIGGTTFQSGYESSAFPQYKNNNQCVAYNDKGELNYCK